MSVKFISVYRVFPKEIRLEIKIIIKWKSILNWKDLDHMLCNFILGDNLRYIKYTGEIKVDFWIISRPTCIAHSFPFE